MEPHYGLGSMYSGVEAILDTQAYLKIGEIEVITGRPGTGKGAIRYNNLSCKEIKTMVALSDPPADLMKLLRDLGLD